MYQTVDCLTLLYVNRVCILSLPLGLCVDAHIYICHPLSIYLSFATHSPHNHSVDNSN
jgi:hypothetical protein